MGEIISKEDGKIIILIRELGVAYIIISYNGRFCIKYLLNKFSLPISLDILRIVRGVLIALAQEGGLKKVHMSVVAIKNNAVAFVGDKNAGKTSFMLAFLKQFRESSFLTNDKALLNIDKKNRDIIVWGLPYAISIGFGALDCYKEIPFDSQKTRIIKDKAYYWPQELTKYMNRTISTPGVILSSIFVVQIDPTDTQLSCSEVKFNKNEFIQKNIINFSDKITPYWLLELLSIEFVQENDELINLLAHNCLYNICGNPCKGNLKDLMEKYCL